MRWAFNLILAAYVLAYVSFVQTILVVVGGRKVHLVDAVFAFLLVGILIALSSSKPRDAWGLENSTKALALFTGWGLFELARGIPRFGLSAVGESRYFFLSALFFFFVLAAYRDRNALKRMIAFAVALVCVMPLVRAVAFYLMGGRAAFVDQFAGSGVLSAQASFRFIQGGEAALVSCVAVGLLMFAAEEDARKRRYALFLLATSLLVVLAIVQVRSAWVTSAVGIVLGSILVVRFFKYAAVSVAVAAVALAAVGPIGSFLQRNSAAGGKDPQAGITQTQAPGLGAPRADPTARSAQTKTPQAGTTQGAGPPAGTAQTEAFHASVGYSAVFLTNPGADVTTAWRLALWRQALANARNHPLLGEGLGGYWKNVGPNGAPVNQTPHNGYLAVLVKLGGVGLALLLIGLSLWCVELLRFIRHEPDRYFRLLGKAVLVAVAMSATFACFFDFMIAFWVLLGVGTVLVRGQSSSAPV